MLLYGILLQPEGNEFFDALSQFGKGRGTVYYYCAPNVTDDENRDALLLHINWNKLEKLQNHF
jgi:hypothetical protein